MYDPDAILTLQEVAAALRLDARTLSREVRLAMGGKTFGRCWRFLWANVQEYMHANTQTGQGRTMDGPCTSQQWTTGVQDVPGRAQGRPGVAGGKAMGGGHTTAGINKDNPFGL